MSDRKQESVLRIMEALSGVDEELLERCETVGSREKNGRKRTGRGLFGYRAMRRGGALCAACLCAVLIGAACWKGALLSKDAVGGGQNGGEENDALAPMSMEAAQERNTDGQEAAPEEVAAGAAYELFVPEEPNWIDVARLAETAQIPASGCETGVSTHLLQPGDGSGQPAGSGSEERKNPAAECLTENGGQSAGSGPAGEKESAAEDLTKKDGQPAGSEPEEEKTDLTEMIGLMDAKREEREAEQDAGKNYSLCSAPRWEEVCAESGMEGYVPSWLPEGYFRLKAEGKTDAEGRSCLTLCWSDGTNGLWIRLTATQLNPEAEYTWEPPVFHGEEDWQSRIPQPGEDGSIRFALLFADGVLAEYTGRLSEEEIAALFRN